MGVILLRLGFPPSAAQRKLRDNGAASTGCLQILSLANEQTVTPPIPARLSVTPTSVLPVQYVKISLKYLKKHPPNKQILWAM